jgi:hypothetical protein
VVVGKEKRWLFFTHCFLRMFHSLVILSCHSFVSPPIFPVGAHLDLLVTMTLLFPRAKVFFTFSSFCLVAYAALSCKTIFYSYEIKRSDGNHPVKKSKEGKNPTGRISPRKATASASPMLFIC